MLASIPWEEYLLVETFNVGEENCTIILSCYNHILAAVISLLRYRGLVMVLGIKTVKINIIITDD